MEGTLGDVVPSPPPMLGRPHRNVRGGPLSVPQVVAFTPREVPREVRRANLQVTVGSSERDPLGELGFGPVEAAYLHRVDLLPSPPPVPVAIPSPAWCLRQLLFRVR
jgi:acetoacetate decarboxylase